MANVVQPGETERFDCEECGVEFAVTLEPKLGSMPAKQRDKEAATMRSASVTHCPFCGAEVPDPNAATDVPINDDDGGQ